MARKGLSSKLPAADQQLRDVIETLAADHDVMSSTVTTLIGSANVPPGASIVAYVGGASQTLTLPPANALGANVGSVVFLLNLSSGNVTVIPSRGDLVNATTSLVVATNVVAILVSDGVSKWLRNV